MTIACTRCGATQDGDIISPPLAFGFKHNAKCGHGVGPLAVLPASYKARQKEEFKKVEKHIIFDEVKEVKAETKVEKSKSKKEKTKVFGKQD